MPIPRFPIRSRIDGRLVHPGEVLRDVVMWEYDAIELEDALGLSAHFWLALQADYDIETLRRRPARRPAKGRRPLKELGPSEPLEDPVQKTYDAIGNRSIDSANHDARWKFRSSFRLASWRVNFLGVRRSVS